MVTNESNGCGDSEKCSPEVALSPTEAACHFMLTVPRSSRREGAAGVKNNLKFQWVVGMSSGMAHSTARGLHAWGRGFTFPGSPNVSDVKMR